MNARRLGTCSRVGAALGWHPRGDRAPDLQELAYGVPDHLRRKAARFEAEGMESLFGSEAARKRKTLPPAMRRLIVDLKAEHPGLNRNEISRVCYVRFGRRPAHLSALAAAARFRWPAEDL